MQFLRSCGAAWRCLPENVSFECDRRIQYLVYRRNQYEQRRIETLMLMGKNAETCTVDMAQKGAPMASLMNESQERLPVGQHTSLRNCRVYASKHRSTIMERSTYL